MIRIITHRGLEPENENFPTESTYEAFADQIKRGVGIEFDINFTKDDQIIIFHDSGLNRITNGKDGRLFSEMNLSEIKKIKLNECRVCTFNELMGLIESSKSDLHFLHLKSKFQEKKYLDIIIKKLTKYSFAVSKLIIFDIKIDTAMYLKEQIINIQLAPSIAHDNDIKRYNNVVGNTLISIDEAIIHKELFRWVWLDEWDRTDENNNTKSLYNKEIFEKLRNNNFKIALVSPELHTTSPNLLGDESHQDAQDREKLETRLGEIIKLKPDAICTDYPDLINRILNKIK